MDYRSRRSDSTFDVTPVKYCEVKPGLTVTSPLMVTWLTEASMAHIQDTLNPRPLSGYYKPRPTRNHSVLGQERHTRVEFPNSPCKHHTTSHSHSPSSCNLTTPQLVTFFILIRHHRLDILLLIKIHDWYLINLHRTIKDLQINISIRHTSDFKQTFVMEKILNRKIFDRKDWRHLWVIL